MEGYFGGHVSRVTHLTCTNEHLDFTIMPLPLSWVILSVVLPLAIGASRTDVSKASSACTGTISSMSDVSSAVKCTTVNINSFTVPAGETLNLDLEDGTTVNMSMSANNSPGCSHDLLDD